MSYLASVVPRGVEPMQSIATSLMTFTAAASLLTVTPGLDTALVLRTAATEGSRRAALAGLGIVVGCLAWAAVVAAGLGVLLEAPQLAYTVLRWVGAAYLVWVGYQLLRHPRTTFATGVPELRAGRGAFARGALTNLLNPKVGIFYVSFLPQFVPDNVPVVPYTMLLGTLHALLGAVWFACLIGATRPLTRVMRRGSVVQFLDRATGGIFIAFGVALAAESRR
jgi:threonine/homoserine/homoserine lactone efflux protein